MVSAMNGRRSTWKRIGWAIGTAFDMAPAAVATVAGVALIVVGINPSVLAVI